jgi:RNA polymerase sigma factor (sigma-70 family)
VSDLPGNPLRSDDPRDWERLIESLGPASLLVAIEGRMSAELSARISAEDILQDTLLHLWRDRERIEWRGEKSFRSLVVSMAIHRIQDAADSAAAAKRGGGRAPLSLDGSDAGGRDAARKHAPVRSTTPSRVAMHRERADCLRRALESLPSDLREVVRLRTFEQMPLAEIAAHLRIGLSAVRHRLRRGSELYAERLRAALDTSAVPPDSAAPSRSPSSS